MKWITRSHVHVDRVACPWLILRFIDSEAEFLFVPRSQIKKLLPIPVPPRSMRLMLSWAITRDAVRLSRSYLSTN
jgi:hypothetical protein